MYYLATQSVDLGRDLGRRTPPPGGPEDDLLVMKIQWTRRRWGDLVQMSARWFAGSPDKDSKPSSGWADLKAS